MNAILLYFGHGRALEAFLGLLKLLIGITLILSGLDTKTPTLADLAWYYPSLAIAAPFFTVSALQLSGLALNIMGHEWSWMLRAAGALGGIFMWSAFILKTSLIGESSLVLPLALAALPASSFLLYKAWNRLPIPGAAGLV